MLNSKNQIKNIDLQMVMNMKAWQNLYNFAHEYSVSLNYRSSKKILGWGCNKWRRSWRHGWKHFEMLVIKELPFIHIGNWIVKYVCFMFIALANLITTSSMHLPCLYQIDLSLKKQFQNILIFLLQLNIQYHSQVFKQNV